MKPIELSLSLAAARQALPSPGEPYFDRNGNRWIVAGAACGCRWARPTAGVIGFGVAELEWPCSAHYSADRALTGAPCPDQPKPDWAPALEFDRLRREVVESLADDHDVPNGDRRMTERTIDKLIAAALAAAKEQA